MGALDPRSLIFVASLLALICVVIMFALRRSFPRSIGGIDIWAWGTLMVVGCAVLFGLRGRIPDFFSVIVANGLLVGGLMAMNVAMRRFAGETAIAYVRYAAVLVGMLAALTWFTFADPDYRARLVVVTCVLVLLFFRLAVLAWRGGKGSFAAGLTAFASGVSAAFSGLRLVSALFGLDAPQGLFDQTTFQTIYLAAFNITVLISTIGFMLMANDRLRETLEYLASRDALSGAFNRRSFLELAEAELARARRHERPLSLLMIDLDHFKAINDGHGHLVGDRVIADFARRTGETLRMQDALGRYGGEEFAVLLPETRLDEACRAAERIRAGLRDGGELPSYTVSIGAAQAARDMSLDALLAAADAALYRAKAGGRDRVEPAGADLPPAAP